MESGKAYFSIVMPYYKNSHVVKRSISSVLSQTYSHFELIIIDDGSFDNLDDIVEEYNDLRVRVIHQTNHGVAYSRNVGVKSAKYEWVCFLDSDDEWLCNHLETLCGMITRHPDAKMLFTSHKRLGNSGIFDSSESLPNELPGECVCENLLGMVSDCGEIINTNSTCIKRSMFDLYGLFSESSVLGEDTDLWYRFSMRTAPILTKEVTTIYHRDASYLTKHTKYVDDWPFAQREELCLDESIPLQRRESAKMLILRYQLSRCKHLLAAGKKKKCLELYKEIKCEKINGKLKKSLVQVKLLLIAPGWLSKIVSNNVFKRKQRKY